MGGNRIKMAREALVLFLKSLPFNCYFNIYSFGNNFVKLFESSQRYEETVVQ